MEPVIQRVGVGKRGPENLGRGRYTAAEPARLILRSCPERDQTPRPQGKPQETQTSQVAFLNVHIRQRAPLLPLSHALDTPKVSAVTALACCLSKRQFL